MPASDLNDPKPIRVLLSGFEPFAGAEANESWRAVQVAARLFSEGHPQAHDPAQAPPAESMTPLLVDTLELPVVFGDAADVLLARFRSTQPGLVIAVGLAAGRTGITPEKVAINLQDARIPDNAGRSPIDEPCVPDGPDAYFSALPVKAMVAAARSLDIPAAVSHTAGTFVCNDVAYRLAHAHASSGDQDRRSRAGFVHVPSADELDPETAGRALAAMVRAALAHRTDVHVAGGAIH